MSLEPWVPVAALPLWVVLTLPNCSGTLCVGVHQDEDSWPLLDGPLSWRAGPAAPHSQWPLSTGFPHQTAGLVCECAHVTFVVGPMFLCWACNYHVCLAWAAYDSQPMYSCWAGKNKLILYSLKSNHLPCIQFIKTLEPWLHMFHSACCDLNWFSGHESHFLPDRWAFPLSWQQNSFCWQIATRLHQHWWLHQAVRGETQGTVGYIGTFFRHGGTEWGSFVDVCLFSHHNVQQKQLGHFYYVKHDFLVRMQRCINA